MSNRWIIAAAIPLVCTLTAYRAHATTINNIEPNNTPGTAQNIDPYFSLEFSPDIGDATGANTSTQIPHVTINAFGPNSSAGSWAWYSFTVGTSGSRGIFDIDYACNTDFGCNWDAWIELWDSSFNLVTNPITWSDDSSTVNGAGGSGSAPGWTGDSFFEYVFTTPGAYYIGVASCCSFYESGGNAVGGDFALQVSLENAGVNAVPEPATLTLVGGGLLGIVRAARRRRR